MSVIKWEDLPSEIRHKMLDYQEAQGNTRNPEVFIKKIYSTKEEGGFDWIKTLEQESFWSNILRGDFNSFFEKYPKSIPSTKDEFQKGDYIVTLVDAGSCGKINYCSKQKVNDIYLKPCIDTKGHTDNGNRIFDIKDKSNTKWRYATKEEAAEYERIGKPYDVTTLNKPQFIVGKWYKFFWTFSNEEVIIKVKSVTDAVVTTSFRVYLDTKDINSNSKDGYRLKAITNIKELSLEEIQEYLPEGHPDKVVNKTELHEIHNESLVGRYFKVLKQFSNKVKKGDYLKITEDLEDGCYNTKEYGCLNQDRLKDKEVELMPEGFEPDNDTIPEYVECVKTWYGGGAQSKIGKIYKTSLKPVFSVHSWEDIYQSKINPNYFKPSTKEAYEAQFISKEEFVLPEKWCIKTTKENIKYLNDYLKHNNHKYKNYLASWKVDVGHYFHSESPHNNSVCHSKNGISTGFKEITFEQFKEYVFKNMYQKGSFITVNENTVYNENKSDDRITYSESIQKEPTLYIKSKQNLLYTENFKTNELSLPTLIKPKKSLLINH